MRLYVSWLARPAGHRHSALPQSRFSLGFSPPEHGESPFGLVDVSGFVCFLVKTCENQLVSALASEKPHELEGLGDSKEPRIGGADSEEGVSAKVGRPSTG